MRVHLRSGTVADATEILALWQNADAPTTHTDDVESIGALLAHDPDGMLVATDDDGHIVGSVIAAWDGWRGSIYRLVVARSHRRQGLGRQLLRFAEDRLGKRGAKRCQAIVVETDEDACAFWRASGWEEQVERIRFVTG